MMPAAPRSPAPRARRRSAALAVIAAVALALVGGAYYLLAIYLPGQKLVPARAEIARWEERLAEARTCLLGEPPASSDTREALAIRELSPDPWNRHTCTQAIGQLSRGEAEDTGVPAIEGAWRGIESAAGKVGAAFLAHVDPMGEPAKDRKPDRLPAALDELDLAHAALREAADLPPPPARPATPPLPAAEIIPLRDGDKPIVALVRHRLPTMGGVIARAKSERRELQLTLAPGVPAVAQPVGPGVRRTVPDAAWGAFGDMADLVIGPLDEGGILPPPEGRTDKRLIQLEEMGHVLAIVGTAEDGLVAIQGEVSLILVRSKAGKLTADKPIRAIQIAYAIDPAGRALLAYNDDNDGELHAFVARGAAPADPLNLGSTRARDVCLTAKHAWIVGHVDDEVVSFGVDGVSVKLHRLPRHNLRGCTATAALLHQQDAMRFLVCADECRVAALQGVPPTWHVALAGDEVVAVLHRDQLLGVWREKGPPRYFKSSVPLRGIELVLADGKAIDVVAQSAGGVVIARLPAR